MPQQDIFVWRSVVTAAQEAGVEIDRAFRFWTRPVKQWGGRLVSEQPKMPQQDVFMWMARVVTAAQEAGVEIDRAFRFLAALSMASAQPAGQKDAPKQ